MADEYSRECPKVRQQYSLEDGRNDCKSRRNKHCFFPQKPSVDIAFVDDGQLILF
jgi:hypothetical protein